MDSQIFVMRPNPHQHWGLFSVYSQGSEVRNINKYTPETENSNAY